MIGIDTNVLVRFLVDDDPGQGRAARALFGRLTEAVPGFLPREVILESAWVLDRAYGFPRERIAAALSALLEVPEVVVEDADEVGLALHRYRKGGPGFADHLIQVISMAAGCETVMTFDRKAGAMPGATLLT
ncbi:PIN domain-containing protein [Palleronia sp.]|uniref:PIN domain-containing protein n=1 Tax=Palleronia sp. TaxID=1940284 RepID=UPI0035C79BB7